MKTTPWTLDETKHSMKADFAISDVKGRTVGAIASVQPAPVYGEIGPGMWTSPLLGYKGFLVSIWSTRNGTSFGAIPRSTFFETLEEAQAAAEKKLQASYKKVARASAKNAGVYVTGK